MKTTIILIRHGETDWNVAGRYQGHSDIDINANGRRQAGRLAKHLRKAAVYAVYSSDRKRAKNTARIIFGRRRIKVEPELREICFGIFEGLVYEEILNKHRALYSRWIKDPFGVKIPKGESGASFKRRISRAFRRIASENRGHTVAIVTHGGPINVILKDILKIGKRRDFIPGHVSMSTVEVSKSRARAISLNDMEHLSNG